jgi:hypothetical protein
VPHRPNREKQGKWQQNEKHPCFLEQASHKPVKIIHAVENDTFSFDIKSTKYGPSTRF